MAAATSASRSFFSLAPVTTCGAHGCTLQFEGANCASSNTSRSVVSGTSSGRKPRTDRRRRIDSSTLITVRLCRLTAPPQSTRRRAWRRRARDGVRSRCVGQFAIAEIPARRNTRAPDRATEHREDLMKAGQPLFGARQLVIELEIVALGRNAHLFTRQAEQAAV